MRRSKAGTPATLSFRIDAAMSRDLDEETRIMAAEGWTLNRTDIVRKLLREALTARRGARKNK